MKTSYLSIISAAAFAASSAFATDYLLSGGTSEENATKFSTGIKNYSDDVVVPSSSDRVLWKGLNSSIATKPAYTVVDGQYAFKSLIVSGGGGSFTDLNMAFEDGASLTFFEDVGIGFNNYAIAMDLSVKNGGSAAINLTNGWYLTLPAGTGRSGSTASIKIGKGITVTSSKAVTVIGKDANTVFTVDGTFTTSGDSTFDGGLVNINGEYTTSRNNILKGGVSMNVAGKLTAESNTQVQNSSLTIQKGATYTTSGDSTFDGGLVNINGEYTTSRNILKGGVSMNVAGKLTAESNTQVQNSSLTIQKGATYTTSELELTPDNDDATTASNLVVNGTLNVNGYFFVSKHGNIKPTVTIGEGAVINAQTFRSRVAPITLTKDSIMTLHNHSNERETFANAGLFTIQNGATLRIITDLATCAAGKNYNVIVLNRGGKFEISGGKYFALGNTMTLNDVLDIDTHFAFGKNTDTNAGSLIVNTDNTWTKTVFLVSKSYNDKGEPTNTHGKITIADNVSLTARGIAFATDKAAQFEINLGSGSVLMFDEFIVTDIADYGLIEGDKIVINGFAEKSVAINKHNSLADDALAYLQISGVDNSKLGWALDATTGKYWLTAVPEPAEWAAIFGAIALGLALYRRRR